MALNVLAGSSVTGASSRALFLTGDSSAQLQRQTRIPASSPRSCRSTTVRSSRLPLNPREAKEMAEGRNPEKPSESGGAGPNPLRFFQNFKDSLFQDHKRLQKEKNLPKGDILYTVVNGDTLYKISDRHDCSLELLMEANGIEDPNNLSVGQEIWIPRTYQIKKGDTLYSISNQFGIKMEAIQEANGIDDPNFIHEVAKFNHIIILSINIQAATQYICHNRRMQGASEYETCLNFSKRLGSCKQVEGFLFHSAA